jgi:hypothetical protein
VSGKTNEFGTRHWPGRVAAVRLPFAVLWTALLAISGLGCSEQERPSRVRDVRVDDTDRVLTGSFGPRDAGAGLAGGGAGGASSCPPDATPCAASMAGSSGSSAGAASSAASDGTLTLRQTYEAVCEGSTVQWGFLTYRATTPGDSSIEFRVRTAATEDQLLTAEYIDLITASAALGTQRCSFTGPAPCPIDLFVVLGGAPLAHHPLSELELVLRPDSSDGTVPTVDDWNLNYSCTMNQ